jgi:ABC-type Mn2+/Zn2+ transport system permease subunit
VEPWIIDTFGSVEALVQVTLAAVVGGVVGVHVVLRRLPFLVMGLTHATFPGLVLAGLAGVNLMAGALVFGLVVVAAIVGLGATDQVESSSAIGVVLAAGFALGVVLVSASDGFTRNVSAYLVGSVATVSPSDVVITAVVAAVILATLALFHKELVLSAFDPGALAALGYRVLLVDLILMASIEIAVVTTLPAMGTVLCVSLLVAPAAAARQWSDDLVTTMALAAGIGVVSGATGLALSVAAHTSAGATVALVAAAIFVASVAARAARATRLTNRFAG